MKRGIALGLLLTLVLSLAVAAPAFAGRYAYVANSVDVAYTVRSGVYTPSSRFSGVPDGDVVKNGVWLYDGSREPSVGWLLQPGQGNFPDPCYYIDYWDTINGHWCLAIDRQPYSTRYTYQVTWASSNIFNESMNDGFMTSSYASEYGPANYARAGCKSSGNNDNIVGSQQYAKYWYGQSIDQWSYFLTSNSNVHQDSPLHITVSQSYPNYFFTVSNTNY